LFVFHRCSRTVDGGSREFILHVGIARIVVHAAERVGCRMEYDIELFHFEEEEVLQRWESRGGGIDHVGDWCRVGTGCNQQ